MVSPIVVAQLALPGGLLGFGIVLLALSLVAYALGPAGFGGIPPLATRAAVITLATIGSLALVGNVFLL